jgi:hypothetical protein
MIGMVADAELISNDRGDALGGPDLTEEAEGFRSSGEQARELCQLVRGQPRHGAGWRLAV